MKTAAEIIQFAQISQYLADVAIAKRGNLTEQGGIQSNISRLLYCVRKNVEYKYAQVVSSSTLNIVYQVSQNPEFSFVLGGTPAVGDIVTVGANVEFFNRQTFNLPITTQTTVAEIYTDLLALIQGYEFFTDAFIDTSLAAGTGITIPPYQDGFVARPIQGLVGLTIRSVAQDDSLNATLYYLYSLCRRFGLNAQAIVGRNTGGGTTSPASSMTTSEYYSLSAVATLVPAPGQPTEGLFTYSDARLVGAEQLTYLIVNNNEETIVGGQFSFNSVSGTITRTNQWFSGDTLIINFLKKNNNTISPA